MNRDVLRVIPLPEYESFVETKDSRKGVLDLKPYLDHSVLRELQSEAYFRQVGIEFGAVIG